MKTGNLSFRQSALISGLSLLMMAILAGVANFRVIESIKAALAAGDPGSILVSMSIPGRWAALAFVVVAILDILVAWSLYEMFRPEMKALSLLTAWFRILYTAIFTISIAVLFMTFRLAESSLDSAVASFLFFKETWALGLVFFGAHLILLGWLIIRSLHIHWIFGLLMIVAGLGYAIDSIALLLAPDSGVNIALFTFIGELVFMFWLLIKALKPESNPSR